jgi:hypothetical protein
MLQPTRSSSWLFAAGPPRKTCLRLLVLPIFVFGIALLLPSIRVQVFGNEPKMNPGWMAAWLVEAVMFQSVLESAGQLFGRAPAPTPFNLSGDWSFISGVSANHLFALACLAGNFRRLRITFLLSAAAAVLTLTCLLPSQLLNWQNGWELGPGYFAWCAAPLSLATLTRPGRRLVPTDRE